MASPKNLCVNSDKPIGGSTQQSGHSMVPRVLGRQKSWRDQRQKGATRAVQKLRALEIE